MGASLANSTHHNRISRLSIFQGLGQLEMIAIDPNHEIGIAIEEPFDGLGRFILIARTWVPGTYG